MITVIKVYFEREREFLSLIYVRDKHFSLLYSKKKGSDSEFPFIDKGFINRSLIALYW